MKQMESCLSVEFNGYVALVAFTTALRRDFRMLTECEMNDAPLVWGHGLEDNRALASNDLPRDAFGERHQRLFPSRTVPLDIENDTRPCLDPPVDDHVDKVLDLGKMIAPATDQHA